MSHSGFKAPAYLHHKARNKGRVRVNGKDVYLPGKFDSKESRDAYREVVARLAQQHREKLIKGRRGEEILKGECLVVELMVDYLKYADQYYAESNEPSSIRYAIQPLRDLFGRLGVDEVSPKKLKAAREAMIAKGWSRTNINKAVSRILRMFRWGVAEELVQPMTYQALKAVEPLKYGRCGDVPETKPVVAVSDEDIEVIRDHVLPEVWAMIQVQRFSGMRPGEVCELRGKHIERADVVWIYKPDKHKNAWRRKERIVFLGPTCQGALMPFVQANPDAYVFSPRQAMQRQRASRVRTSVGGNRPGYSRGLAKADKLNEDLATSTRLTATGGQSSVRVTKPEFLVGRLTKSVIRKHRKFEANMAWKVHLPHLGIRLKQLRFMRKGI